MNSPTDAPEGVVVGNLRERLVSAGFFVPTSQAGVYGFGGHFESVVAMVGAALTRTAERACATEPEVFLFPPIIPEQEFRRSAYLDSFPQLVGMINAFHGAEGADEAMVKALPKGDPRQAFTYAELAMLSAACHPLYAMLADSEVPQTRVLTVTGRCFRHEPSPDPMRLQAFRMTEYVAVGTEAEVAGHADRWAAAIPDMFAELGLDTAAEAANDPFFGRTRHMLAAMQRDLQQKVEFVAQVHPGEEPTAIASVNRPGTHFGGHFAITAGGEPAHTVCVAFGIERIAVAMLARHGFDADGIHFG